MLVLEDLVDLVFIEPFNFSFFSITGQGIDLDYCDTKWFTLEKSRGHLLFWRLHLSSAFWTLLLTMMATPFLEVLGYSKGFLPTVVDIMVI